MAGISWPVAPMPNANTVPGRVACHEPNAPPAPLKRTTTCRQPGMPASSHRRQIGSKCASPGRRPSITSGGTNRPLKPALMQVFSSAAAPSTSRQFTAAIGATRPGAPLAKSACQRL